MSKTRTAGCKQIFLRDRQRFGEVPVTAKRSLQIAISVLLVGLLIWWVDPRELGRAMADAEPIWIIAALLVATANRILMAVKWTFLLAARGIHVSWTRATKIYYQSTFLGIFLPPTVGGDVVRAWLVTRDEKRLPEIASSIVMERVIGLLALAVFGIVAAALLPGLVGEGGIDTSHLLATIAGASLVMLGGFVFSFSTAAEKIILSLSTWLAKVPVIGRFAGLLGKIHVAYRDYRHDRGTLVLFFFLTMLENSLPILRAWMVAMALGVSVSPLWFLVIVPLELVLIRIPLSFDGFGIREGLFVWFLALAGVAESTGFAVGLANHMIFLIAVLPGALFYLLDPGARNARTVKPA